MKKNLLPFFYAICLFALMQSCTKEVHQGENIKEITIDTTIRAGADFNLSLAPYGDDDNIADIIQQAHHYSVSRLEDLSDTFNPIYHYVADVKSSGPDQVVLAISKNPGCKRSNRDSTIITINFIIK